MQKNALKQNLKVAYGCLEMITHLTMTKQSRLIKIRMLVVSFGCRSIIKTIILETQCTVTANWYIDHFLLLCTPKSQLRT